MRSKCIDFTSGGKSVTGNEFSDIQFPLWQILAIRRCFSCVVAIFHCACAFRPYYYFWFKIWRHIWILHTRFTINTRSFRARDTIFGDFCDRPWYSSENVADCLFVLRHVLDLTNYRCAQQSTYIFYRATACNACNARYFCRNSVRLSVHLSDRCIVTKLNDRLRILWYHTKGQSL